MSDRKGAGRREKAKKKPQHFGVLLQQQSSGAIASAAPRPQLQQLGSVMRIIIHKSKEAERKHTRMEEAWMTL